MFCTFLIFTAENYTKTIIRLRFCKYWPASPQFIRTRLKYLSFYSSLLFFSQWHNEPKTIPSECTEYAFLFTWFRWEKRPTWFWRKNCAHPTSRLQGAQISYSTYHKGNLKPQRPHRGPSGAWWLTTWAGAFFWGYSICTYSGLRITEYTEYQFPKELICRTGSKRTRLPSIRSIPILEWSQKNAPIICVNWCIQGGLIDLARVTDGLAIMTLFANSQKLWWACHLFFS